MNDKILAQLEKEVADTFNWETYNKERLRAVIMKIYQLGVGRGFDEGVEEGYKQGQCY